MLHCIVFCCVVVLRVAESSGRPFLACTFKMSVVLADTSGSKLTVYSAVRQKWLFNRGKGVKPKLRYWCCSFTASLKISTVLYTAVR